ncbi:hypothetical protein [Nonomuraea sp. LPB2021202275-12-8]|uniref:hypothetical protein n=1 Tax=Nonomuraea sp. LPB2021202275-12-8 TaxID=3120159 RepID=UPI00300C07AC
MGEALDVVVRFGSSGRLGPLRCGMPLQELETLIGPFHDRMHDSKPRRWRPRLHFWDDLEVLICHGLVIEVGVPLWRDTVALPSALSGWERPIAARLDMLEVLSALDTAGCEWEEAPGIVVGDRARGIRTRQHDVCLVFAPESHSGDSRLHKIYKSDPEADQNDHSPRQGRATQ